MKFEGIYTPIVTPYNADFSINRDTFAEVVEHLIARNDSLVLVVSDGNENLM